MCSGGGGEVGGRRGGMKRGDEEGGYIKVSTS